MGNGASTRLKRLYTALYNFLTEKWIHTNEELEASRLHRFAHFWLLVFKSFFRNKGPLRATALAYTTLLALVPLLAVCFSFTSILLKGKGQATTRQLVEQLVDAAAPQLKLMPAEAGKPAAREEVVARIEDFVNNAQAKTLGLTGTLGLIVVAILLLSTIEDTFNHIWGIACGRSWFARVVVYWAALTLGPIVLALAGLLVSSGYFPSSGSALKSFPFLGKFFFQGLPFVLVSCAFALFYKLMPNTKVAWPAALVAGAVGGSLWLCLNIFNALNLSRVVSMSAIYGSALGVIPIFLIGLYFSWTIVLFGAQVAYAHQNRRVYLQEKKAEGVNQRGREFVALRVMTHVARTFQAAGKPPAAAEIAEALGVPSQLVSQILRTLVQARLLVEVIEQEPCITLARPLDRITAHDILMALRAGQGLELATREDRALARVRGEFDRIQAAERQAAAVTLQSLAEEEK